MFPVLPVDGLRRLGPDSTLIIDPFPPSSFRSDVHATSYRCVASNSFGKILSIDISIQAIVTNDIAVSVDDTTILKNNTALLRCKGKNVPQDYLTVTSWIKSSNQMTILPSIEAVGDYHATKSGELIIFRVETDHDGYVCNAEHKVTKRTASSLSASVKVVVPGGSISPTILEVNSVLRFRSGEPAIIPCIAQGHPVPIIRWSKVVRHSTIPIPENKTTGTSMFFYPILPDDAGLYRCEASNPVGQSQRDIRIDVVEPPEVSIIPERAAVDLGTSAQFQCVSRCPVLQYTWYFNGGSLPARTTVSGDKLLINVMGQDDCGIYQCLAKCDTGVAQASAQLRLGDAGPVFRQTFVEQTIIPGPFLSLICEAWSIPVSKFSWSLDGFPVVQNERVVIGSTVTASGSLISYLNITSVNVEDGGKYTCIFENKKGRIQHSRRVNVYGLPYVRPVGRLMVPSGSDHLLTCPASGYPLADLVWQIDGVTLKSHQNFTVYSNGSLLLRNANSESHSKTYRCLATDRQGNIAQGDIPVQVLTKPRIEPFSFQEHLSPGMRTRILCGISMGTPPFAIYWLKDALPVNSASQRLEVKLLDEFTSVLSISNLSMADAGFYECVARNEFFEVKHGSSLSLKVSPFWIKEPVNTTIAQERPLTVDCVAGGYPEPTVTWLRLDGSDENNYRAIPKYRTSVGPYQLTNGSLRIDSVHKYDSGVYRCRASNNVKLPLLRNVVISVTSSPRFLSTPRKFSVRLKELVTMQCDVEGTPPVEITWQKNGMKVQQNSRMSIIVSPTKSGVVSTLTISAVYQEDAGIFVCIASNHYGWSHLEIGIGIQEPPSPPEMIRTFEIKSRQASISWKVALVESFKPLKSLTFFLQLKPRSEQQWNEVKLPRMPLDQKFEYTIQNLLPSTDYEVRMFCETSGGRSQPSDVVSLTTLGEAPSGVVTHLKAAVFSSTEVKLSWVGIPEKGWNSDRIGYSLEAKVEGRNGPPITLAMAPSSDTSVEHEVIMERLAPFTRYTFSIIGSNQYGVGARSSSASVQTMEDAPSVFPGNVQCIVLSSTSIRVLWEEPPLSSVHGTIETYKTFYEPEKTEKGTWKMDVKASSASPVVLTLLEPATTYRIRVAVVNKAGMGPMSPEVTVTTHEEVPDSPADVKVVVASASRVTVCWNAPTKPNGLVTHYNVFYRSAVSSVQPTKEVVPGSIFQHDISSLVSQHPYEFWVRASTKAGAGESSRVVRQIIYTKDGQGICSWGKTIKAFENTEVVLPCKAVCSTSCRWYWNLNKQNLSASERIYSEDQDFLKIKNLRLSDSGNYSCVLKSHLGLESIRYVLHVQKLPYVNYLDAVAVDVTKVSLKWAVETGTPVNRFLLHHREEGGEWDEREVEGSLKSYDYTRMHCGKSYQFYIVAISDFTAGPASAISSVQIPGKAPGPAPPSQALISSINSSQVILDLSQWPSGGCRIQTFDVEYRIDGEPWSDYWRNLVPQPRLYIYDLQSATAYSVRITTTNSAGSSSQEYSFVTLDEYGRTPSQSKIRRGKIVTDVESAGSEVDSPSPFDLPFWLLVASSILGTISLMGLAIVCHLFQKHNLSQSESTTIPLDSSRFCQDTLRKEGVGSIRQVDSTPESDYSRDKKEEDHYEVVRPYATFELQRRSPRQQLSKVSRSIMKEEASRIDDPREVFYGAKRLYRRPPPIDGDSDYEAFPYGTHSRPPPSYHTTGTVMSRTDSAELMDFETYDSRQDKISVRHLRI